MTQSKLHYILRRPSLPGSYLRTRAHSTGADYDTAFSRTPPARIFRSLALEYLIAPVTRQIATPTLINQDVLDTLETPAVIVSNHESHLDTLLLLSVLPRRIRERAVIGAGADYFFDRRTKGFLSALLLGAIPIERTKVSRRSSDLSVELLQKGWNLILFPEGGRTPDGLPQELKAGAAQVALKVGVPILPIYLDGTYELLGKDNSRLQPGKTKVICGKPIHPQTGMRPQALIEVVRQQLEVLRAEAATDFWKARSQPRGRHFPPSSRGWREVWLDRSHRYPAKETSSWPRLFGSSRPGGRD